MNLHAIVEFYIVKHQFNWINFAENREYELWIYSLFI